MACCHRANIRTDDKDESTSDQPKRWLIVGLGNPGRRYANTRHNLGYKLVDLLARRWQIAVDRKIFHALAGDGRFGRHKVVLIKPLTYMNNSGQAVQAAIGFYKQPLEQLLVINDDLAMPVGRLRIRPSGSAGGHKGLADIIGRLGQQDFPRVRIGIDQAGDDDAVEHVLSAFTSEQEPQIQRTLLRAAEAVEMILENGLDMAMTQYNRPAELQAPDQADDSPSTGQSDDGPQCRKADNQA